MNTRPHRLHGEIDRSADQNSGRTTGNRDGAEIIDAWERRHHDLEDTVPIALVPVASAPVDRALVDARVALADRVSQATQAAKDGPAWMLASIETGPNPPIDPPIIPIRTNAKGMVQGSQRINRDQVSSRCAGRSAGVSSSTSTPSERASLGSFPRSGPMDMYSSNRAPAGTRQPAAHAAFNPNWKRRGE